MIHDDAEQIAMEHAAYCRGIGMSARAVMASIGEPYEGNPSWDDVCCALSRCWLSIDRPSQKQVIPVINRVSAQSIRSKIKAKARNPLQKRRETANIPDMQIFARHRFTDHPKANADRCGSLLRAGA